MNIVLFLCTGNYYRSRFAEEMFNFRAARYCPDWAAASRGLALERGAGNSGPISVFAAEALRAVLDVADDVIVPIETEPLSFDPTARTINKVIKPRKLPYRVVINEAIDSTKRFGSEHGHTYVNGVLDKAAASLRSLEAQARR